MSEGDGTSYFPSNVYEAIAYLYVQNQDLNGKSVDEIMRLYTDALQKLLSEV